MNETMLHILAGVIAGLITGAFSAGVIWGIAKARYKRLLQDFNGLGLKVREADKREDRRYHNLSMCVSIAAPEDKEAQIAGLLKE